MKKEFEAVCNDCQAKFTSYTTFNEFEQLLIDEKCTDCGGTLRRSWATGGYRMATGATRRPT